MKSDSSTLNSESISVNTAQAISEVGVVSSYQFLDQYNVRVALQPDGEVWFVAADVCESLGLGNPTMAVQRLDPDEVSLSSIEGKGGKAVNIISESGLYSLVLGSRKPEAKRFKKWVTSDVLPAIRKQGFYSAGGALTKDRLALLKMARQLALDIAKSKDAFSRNVLVGLLREIAGALGQPLPALPELGSPKEVPNA